MWRKHPCLRSSPVARAFALGYFRFVPISACAPVPLCSGFPARKPEDPVAAASCRRPFLRRPAAAHLRCLKHLPSAIPASAPVLLADGLAHSVTSSAKREQTPRRRYLSKPGAKPVATRHRPGSRRSRKPRTQRTPPRGSHTGCDPLGRPETPPTEIPSHRQTRGRSPPS